MQTIAELLDKKGHDVWSVEPSDPVFQALNLMAEKNIGAVVVIDSRGRLVGILSERDYARKVVLRGRTSKETLVESIMTPDVLFMTADRSIEQCMALMTAAAIRHLPIMEGDRVIGMVSLGDVAQAIISNQGAVIEQLERYIYGGALG
jgi:CBS domain-containing protein